MNGKMLKAFLVLLLLCVITIYGNEPLKESRERFKPEKKSLSEGWVKSGKATGDSLNCTLVGGWFSGPCYAVYAIDTISYIGDGGYIKILNTKNPSNPVLLGKVRTPSVVRDIYVIDTLAYVADYGDGLRIINVRDPTNPAEVGYYDTEEYALGVYVIDTLAYVADHYDGLRIISVRDPTNPAEVGYYDTGDLALGVYVIDTLAYVADQYDGLRIINVRDPTNPTEVGYYDTGVFAYGVYVLDTLAYVADGWDGLYIIRYTGGAGVEENEPNKEVFFISQGIPNPFMDKTLIEYNLPNGSNVHIVIYNTLGAKIRTLLNEKQNAGIHVITWNGCDNSGKRIPSGFYFLRLEAGEYKGTRKLLLIR